MIKSSIPIRIVHKPGLTERRIYLEENLGCFSDVKFISAEQFGPHVSIRLYSGGSRHRWHRKLSLCYDPVPTYRELTLGEIYTAASHYASWTSFSTEWCVILEDDALITSEFPQRLERIIQSVPNWTDIIFIGGGYPLSSVSTPICKLGEFIFSLPPNTNTAVGYVLRKAAAMVLSCNFASFDAPIDIELSYLICHLNLKVLHLENYIIGEGSKSVYQSIGRISKQFSERST